MRKILVGPDYYVHRLQQDCHTAAVVEDGAPMHSAGLIKDH